jgi:hypothetical protein
MSDALASAIGRESAARRPAAAAVAASALLGFGLQLYSFIGRTLERGDPLGPSLVRLFSYFTIIVNVLVGVALAWHVFAPSSRPGRWAESSRALGALTTSIVLVAIAYHLLLRSYWSPQGLDLVSDRLLHYVTPVLLVGYWVAFGPRNQPRWKDALSWTVLPVAYFGWVLLRGAIVNEYPYPFLDALELGYPAMAVNAAGLLASYLGLALAIIAVSRLRTRHYAMDQPGPLKQEQ